MNRTQEVELTNMCFIYDENRILVEEKKGTNANLNIKGEESGDQTGNTAIPDSGADAENYTGDIFEN